MRPIIALCLSAFLLMPGLALTASTPANSATVMIVNYSDEGKFLGWGSGFFVDEGIIVTNKHVIHGGDWYRVYATNAEDAVDFTCKKDITKSNVKINLDDDVAYMRAYMDCEHGVIQFAKADPADDTPVSVVGYPYRGSVDTSLTILATSGRVTGMTSDGWLKTDASMDVGNSGGPVMHGNDVVGVAVAKGVDEQGNYVTGYFIPASVIVDGLLYANDSQFGYSGTVTPTPRSSSSRSSAPSYTYTYSRSSSSSFAQSAVSSKRSSSSIKSSVRPAPLERVSQGFAPRTCERVLRWFRNDSKMLSRINERLIKRFGFAC